MTIRWSRGITPFLALISGLTVLTSSRGQEETGSVPPALQPSWQIGDSWTLQTIAIQRQVASDSEESPDRQSKVDWQFTVDATQEIQGRDCYRISVVCLSKGHQQPQTTLWFDVNHKTLTRVESKVLIKNQWRAFTETYVSTDGKPCPVLGPIPALPLDFPAFSRDGETKSLASQSYEVIHGDRGTKSLDQVGFAFSVEQSVSAPSEERIKSLINNNEGEELVAVEIRGTKRRVSQVWRTGKPWPLYSNNGMTESRLLKVQLADSQEKGEVQ